MIRQHRYGLTFLIVGIGMAGFCIGIGDPYRKALLVFLYMGLTMAIFGGALFLDGKE